MTIGPDGNLYLLDGVASENFIRVFSPDLRFLREFGKRENGETTLAGSPKNLLFGADGLIWMLDYRSSETVGYDQLVKLDPNSGAVVETIELASDYGISDQLVAALDGSTYLLEASDALVHRVDEQFNVVRSVAVPNANFVDSLGVAADGSFYAGVAQDEVFIHFDEDGTLIKQFGERSETSDTAYPAGVFYNIEKIELFNDNLFAIDESVTYLVSMFP